MGRDLGRPGDYAPLLELYLRRKREGGGVAAGELRGAADAIGRHRGLVLVHGFNNTDGEAAHAYHGFRAKQMEYGGALPEELNRYFSDVFWPGDADLPWFLDYADFLVYPVAVGRARESARALATLLTRMPNLERVDFVAHSLGCRVVLETLLRLEHAALPRVERVCLMAGAVPSEMLEPGGRFHQLLARMQARDTRVYVLHSRNDKVLHLAFPAGQALAGREEASTRALGRYGPTAAMPGQGSTLTDDQVRGAGHSNYWGHVPARASDEATSKAGHFLQLDVVWRSVGTPREIAPPMDPWLDRALGVYRDPFASDAST